MPLGVGDGTAPRGGVTATGTEVGARGTAAGCAVRGWMGVAGGTALSPLRETGGGGVSTGRAPRGLGSTGCGLTAGCPLRGSGSDGGVAGCTGVVVRALGAAAPLGGVIVGIFVELDDLGVRSIGVGVDPVEGRGAGVAGAGRVGGWLGAGDAVGLTGAGGEGCTFDGGGFSAGAGCDGLAGPNVGLSSARARPDRSMAASDNTTSTRAGRRQGGGR